MNFKVDKLSAELLVTSYGVIVPFFSQDSQMSGRSFNLLLSLNWNFDKVSFTALAPLANFEYIKSDFVNLAPML